MDSTDVIKLEGQLAYLKPRSTEWQPLSIKSLLLLKEPSEGKERILTDDEKKKLSQTKQYINDVLLKSLQLPNLTFFAGSGTSLVEVNGPSMWDLWRKSMWLEPDSIKGNDINWLNFN